MVSKTPSKLVNTWLSQNRSTLYPSARSHSSRILSPCSIACCPPSNSMITFLSRFTKSTTYLPMGCWRRNLKPSTCLSLRYLHRCPSVSVDCFLNFLAAPVGPFTPTLFPPPSRGRVLFLLLKLSPRSSIIIRQYFLVPRSIRNAFWPVKEEDGHDMHWTLSPGRFRKLRKSSKANRRISNDE
jgi:hypothetical protein